MSCRLAILTLALGLQMTVGTCPAGAKPFPSNLAGRGTINYADLFKITYYDSYKVIEYSPTLSTYNSGWHPNESMKGEPIPPIVLYQCGTQRPAISDAGITSPQTRFFQIPIQKATIGWGGPLPFFEQLSVTETINLIDLTYISSPCAQLMEECTPGIHLANSNANWSSLAFESEVVFTDSFGTGWAGPEKDVPFQISLDPGTLQRAEWVRFVAAFFNEEAKADQVFSQIQSDYNALKSMAQQLSVDSSTEWGGRQPKVAWINKGWSGNMQISNAHYKRDFVSHAGGRLVPMPVTAPTGCKFTSNTDGSQTLDCATEGMASFKAFLAEADVIVDESYVANYDTTAHNFSSIYGVTAQEVPALARNPPNIFRYDGSVSDSIGAGQQVGSNWFEQMPSQPQQLLAGLMEALWSSSFHSHCGFKFLRRAVQGQGQTASSHMDCPYYQAQAGGNHNCAAIHEHMHEVVQCSLQAMISTFTSTTTTTTTATASKASENEGVDAAMGMRLSIAMALASLAMLVFDKC